MRDPNKVGNKTPPRAPFYGVQLPIKTNKVGSFQVVLWGIDQSPLS